MKVQGIRTQLKEIEGTTLNTLRNERKARDTPAAASGSAQEETALPLTTEQPVGVTRSKHETQRLSDAFRAELAALTMENFETKKAIQKAG